MFKFLCIHPGFNVVSVGSRNITTGLFGLIEGLRWLIELDSWIT